MIASFPHALGRVAGDCGGQVPDGNGADGVQTGRNGVSRRCGGTHAVDGRGNQHAHSVEGQLLGGGGEGIAEGSLYVGKAETVGRFLHRKGFEGLAKHDQIEHGDHGVGKDGGEGKPCHAQIKHDYGYQIPNNIQNGRADGNVQGEGGYPHGGEHLA